MVKICQAIPIKALLLLLFPAFVGLHDNINFLIIGRTQQKFFKGNDRQGDHEQIIICFTMECMINHTAGKFMVADFNRATNHLYTKH